MRENAVTDRHDIQSVSGRDGHGRNTTGHIQRNDHLFHSIESDSKAQGDHNGDTFWNGDATVTLATVSAGDVRETVIGGMAVGGNVSHPVSDWVEARPD